MTQLGESVSIIPPGGKEKCVFCGRDHQKDKAAPKAEFPRDMSKLKSEGRAYSRDFYSGRYPSSDIPPLAKWEKDIKKTGGYKAAAHHCIALKSVSNHEISGELKEAKYDPNRGSNCSWLPYSALQFSRARAYGKPLQKHRGGHTNSYFDKVNSHIDEVCQLIEDNFCEDEKQASKDRLLTYMLIKEKEIWSGIANPRMRKYHLYNHSYLDPSADWGSFPAEVGKTKDQVIGTASSVVDDLKAEEESADDPE